MGLIITKFRKQPTTLEKLKKIEENLRKIEDYKRTTEQAQKRTVANLLIYGVALYILACVIVIVWYLPESWLVRLALLIPLVLVPFIIYWMKRFISWYFESRMVRANEDYADLQRKKKDIIDTVMETETFNKAKEILSKFAPEKLGKKNSPTVAPANTSGSELRQRSPNSSVSSEKQPQSSGQPDSSQASAIRLQNVPASHASNQFAIQPIRSQQVSLPQPLFAKNRSVADKLVEYIVGDGPSYRYALVCKHCREHNGMALQEEFPYMSFLCCYCRKFNPAKITRPIAPRLQEHTPLMLPERLKDVSSPQTSIKDTQSVVTNDGSFPKPIPHEEFMDLACTLHEGTEEDEVESATNGISEASLRETEGKRKENEELDGKCDNLQENEGTSDDELSYEKISSSCKSELLTSSQKYMEQEKFIESEIKAQNG